MLDWPYHAIFIGVMLIQEMVVVNPFCSVLASDLGTFLAIINFPPESQQLALLGCESLFNAAFHKFHRTPTVDNFPCIPSISSVC